jgi:carbonic anhydrase/acetyltransferase-like protein (isoleucine patch superfamily)
LAITFVAPGAQLHGDVHMANESSAWFGAILRGNVTLEERANVQDNCIVEGTPAHPAIIGAHTSLGHNARVYGAVIEPRSLIAIGATVLRGACVGSQSIIAANATVPEDMQVPPRSLVIGHGRILRQVTDAEIERIDRGARDYARLTREYASATR